MAKCDTRELQALAQRLRRAASDEQRQAFYEACCRELAARFLAKVIKRTPVGKGQFEVERGKNDIPMKYKRGKKQGQVKLKRLTNGGTLRRGWTASTEAEAAGGSGSPNAAAYVTGIKVQRAGREYRITITNPVKYASYVEYGHRQTPGRFIPVLGKKTKAGWVKGQFMMTISGKELVDEAPGILAKKLESFLRGVMSGK